MSDFNFSKIVIIEALEHDEFKSGTALCEYINGLKEDNPESPTAHLVDVTGCDGFFSVIEALIEEAQRLGEAPILHIEMHGFEDKSGLSFPDGTSLGWDDLALALTKLNKAIEFNLVVCVAACFGGNFINAVRPDDPSPCFALIGPSDFTDGAELLGSFRSLYRTLLTTLSASDALVALHSHQLNVGAFYSISAEQWFFRLADDYLRKCCTKEKLKERRDAIIEALISEGKEINAAQKAILADMGRNMAFTFLERRFPTFFMTDDIPRNHARFLSSLMVARERVADFIASQS
ncbi:hypothetical protein [Pseudomonas corrugata]|uniref:hypothetical protein n=1 Tax=Pseudomonas corrugata TaxID=47879 RepID=UPI001585F493|nr:hypothetical protein [Pseudomonas corrugata]MCI0993444.1 hypothetical protein [Pseudomonas corrugata]NUT65325.1 hypothetical protein [Pseudomonas corrugata]